MILEKLLLINYRNYQYQLLDFHPRLNIFIGDNAQGKTNLLESIYLAARGASFKNVNDKDFIRFGERSGYVRAEIDRNDRKKIVEVKLSMVDRKRVRINEIEIENLKELKNQFELVLFAPEDLQIIKESPKFRRDFLDDLLKGIDSTYHQELRDFNRILFQRNNLLKHRDGSWFEEQLSATNQQLISFSYPIVKKRKKIIDELKVCAREIHSRLSENKEVLDLFYDSNCFGEKEGFEEDSSSFDKEAFHDKMNCLLDESLERDLDYRNTDIGPHKDDLLISINDLASRKYASQGQARTAALSLRLAELRIVEKYNKISPILLLDDVFSELDEKRTAFLLNSIDHYQTMITTNELDQVPLKQIDGQVFEVVKGQIKKH